MVVTVSGNWALSRELPQLARAGTAAWPAGKVAERRRPDLGRIAAAGTLLGATHRAACHFPFELACFGMLLHVIRGEGRSGTGT